MLIRDEIPADYDRVDEINCQAFKGNEEAKLVARLRQDADPIISLVAVIENDVVGHCMFSPVTLDSSPHLHLMGLAPMAVTGQYQGQGIGSALVREGLQRCGQLGAGAVVVLGHPQYYPRFGFSPAVNFGLNCGYDVPSDTFMVIELEPHYLAGNRGTIAYHQAFAEL